MFRRFMPFVMLLASSSLQAESLSIDRAVELALEQSHRLKASQRISESLQNNLTASRHDRWPSLSLSSNAFLLDEIPTFEIGLPGGPTFEREFGSKQNYQTDLRLTFPLYTGGLLSSQVDLASALLEESQAALKADSEQVILEVKSAAYGLLYAEQLVAASKASLERTRLIRTDVRSKYDAGTVDSVSVLDAAHAMTRAELQLERARIQRRRQQIQIGLLIALPPDSISITDQLIEPFEPQGRQLSNDKPELIAAASRVRQSAASAKTSGSTLRPSLSAYAGYSYGKPNLDRFNNSWNDYLTVGARLDWNLNLGGSQRQRQHAQQLRIEAASHALDELHRNLEQRADLAFEQWRLSYREYLTAKKEFELTEASYRLALEQHESGVLATNRLLEIESELSAAQASLVGGIVNCYQAQTQYLFAVGNERIGRK